MTQAQDDNKEIQTMRSSVFERIERERIAPTDKYRFIARNMFFWSLWGLALILGALSVSVLIFTELNVGWELYEMTHTNALTFFVETLPFVWLLLLGTVMVLGVYNLKHTKHGYRYSLPVIIFIGFSGSIIGGVILHAQNVSVLIDEAAPGIVPFHTSMMSKRTHVWNVPEQGLYTGVIDSLDTNQGTLTLSCPECKEQQLRHFSVDMLPPETFAELATYTRIRIIATSTGDQELLIACHVVPWAPRNARMMGELRERRSAFIEGLEHRIQSMMYADDTDDTENPCTETLRTQGRGINVMMRQRLTR